MKEPLYAKSDRAFATLLRTIAAALFIVAGFCGAFAVIAFKNGTLGSLALPDAFIAPMACSAFALLSGIYAYIKSNHLNGPDLIEYGTVSAIALFCSSAAQRQTALWTPLKIHKKWNDISIPLLFILFFAPILLLHDWSSGHSIGAPSLAYSNLIQFIVDKNLLVSVILLYLFVLIAIGALFRWRLMTKAAMLAIAGTAFPCRKCGGQLSRTGQTQQCSKCGKIVREPDPALD